MTAVVYWDTLLTESGDTVLAEDGTEVLIAISVDAVLVDALEDEIQYVTAGKDGPGWDVDVITWFYLITEAGENVVTEAGDQIMIPYNETVRATLVESGDEPIPVTARED